MVSRAWSDFAESTGTTILKAIKEAIQNLPSTLMNIGRTAISGLGNAIRGAIGFVKSAAVSVGNAVLSALKSIPSKVISIGKDVVRGLWNGISDMSGWVIKKIQGFGESVLGGIKKFFGINSPSRLMRDEVGKYLAQGVGVGFVKNIPIRSMTASMKKAVSDMKVKAGMITSTIPMTANVAKREVTNNYTDFGINYKEFEKAQLNAMNRANQRPVLLNNRQINRALKEGGYVPA